MNEKTLLALAAVVSQISGQVPAMYSAAYHGMSETFLTSVFAGIFASMILGTPAIFCAIFLQSIKPVRFFAITTILFAVYKVLRDVLPGSAFDLPKKAVFIFGAILLIIFFLRYFDEKVWRIISRITIVGVSAWILSVPVIAWTQSGSNLELLPTFSIQRVIEYPPRAVVILILDEMSPKVVDELTDGLGSASHILHVGFSLKAGKHTLYAIPSMLASQRHDGVSVCGFNQLCGEHSFEIDKLRAADSHTDVVGFYHPYCAIHGLRSCWKIDAEKLDASEFRLGVFHRVIARLPLINSLFQTELDHEISIDSVKYTRKMVVENALGAPFWNEGGGVLYIHHYLPHPSGAGAPHQLSEEYRGNVYEAKEFLKALNDRLQAGFQGDYALVITSDHPLRTEMWCKNPIYENQSCVQDNPEESEIVPFIVLAPKGVKVKMPLTNVGVFVPPS